MMDVKRLEAMVAQLMGPGEYVVGVEGGPDRVRVVIDSLVGVSIDECTRVHRGLQAMLPESFEGSIEVSSPGAVAFIHHPRQWETAVGRHVMVWTSDGRHLSGRLTAYDPRGGTLFLATGGGKRGGRRLVALSINQISKAKTVLA